MQLPDKGSWMLHCIARDPDKEATAPAFAKTG
jgi:hypothetical protein